MATATRRKRSKSNFKKRNGSMVSMRPQYQTRQQGSETIITEHWRPTGGYGYFYNTCGCKSCKYTRNAF